MEEREVLETLYAETGGDRWMQKTGWLSEQPLGEWHGITTDPAGRVTHLDLSFNNLAGRIPACLEELEHLEVLELRSNALWGSIPPGAVTQKHLKHLALSDNDLTGGIPQELGAHPEIRRIILEGNPLEGPLPPGLGDCPQLIDLSASGCSLTGHIPPELARAPRLEILDLADNELDGEVPEALEDMGLRELNLQDNHLEGVVNDAESITLTGHVGEVQSNRLTLTTCPEWPPRRVELIVDSPNILDGLRAGQLVEASFSRRDGKNIAWTLTPEWEDGQDRR